MFLQALLPFIGDDRVTQMRDPFITGIEIDSREVREGNLFVAIKGHTVDGHDYIEEAVTKGASVIVAEKECFLALPDGVIWLTVSHTEEVLPLLATHYYGYPAKELTLIGVTGTNGKTTTSCLLQQLLQNAGISCGLIGTMHSDIGGEILPSTNTTPDVLTLQKMLRKMVEKGVTHVVMEVSSHALSLDRIYGCEFACAIFTNLTQDHLDFHGSMEDYKHAKGKLFNMLSTKGVAILNADEVASVAYGKATKAKVVTYGIKEGSQVRASDISMESGGTTFKIGVDDVVYLAKTPLLGTFNVYNVLGAFSAAKELGVPLEVLMASLEDIKGVTGRLEGVRCGQDFQVIVDYAHTPDGLENVLETLSSFTTGRILTVVGCGGNRDTTKRPIMARIAEQYSDLVVLTSDNPRMEDPVDILRDMEKGIEKSEGSVSIPDRKEAISFALRSARSGDSVLIAGKGHETYQIIGDQAFYFNDREVAIEALMTSIRER